VFPGGPQSVEIVRLSRDDERGLGRRDAQRAGTQHGGQLGIVLEQKRKVARREGIGQRRGFPEPDFVTESHLRQRGGEAGSADVMEREEPALGREVVQRGGNALE
jgi:hypothetical protein